MTITLREILVIYGIIINLASFIVYGIDKRKAVKGKWRIPESTLIGLAAVGGCIGAAAGMKLFHHKTKHMKFRITVPLFIVIYLAMIIYFVCIR